MYYVAIDRYTIAVITYVLSSFIINIIIIIIINIIIMIHYNWRMDRCIIYALCMI